MMRIYTVHKTRLLVVAMATGTLVLLMAIAFIRHPSNMDAEWSYTDDVRWKLHQSGKVGGSEENSTDSMLELSNSILENGQSGDIAPPNNHEESENVNNELDPNEPELSDVDTLYDKNGENDYDEYDSDDDDENENSVFRDGDFDIVPTNAAAAPQLQESKTDTMLDNRGPKEFDSDAVIGGNQQSTSGRDKREIPSHQRSSPVGSFGLNKHVFDRRLQAKLEPEFQATSSPVETQQPEPMLIRDTWATFSASTQDRGLRVVEHPVFWSKELESRAPRGFHADHIRMVQNHLRQQVVTDIAPPTWNRCGRPKNQYLTLSDGSHVCARYRAPHNYLVQGELMSFYLGRLLALDNIPIVVISKLNPQDKQWGSHSSMDPTPGMVAAGWEVNATVAFIQWIDGLERDKMPQILINALQRRKTISAATRKLKSATIEQLLELLQWSDLIVFDYITGNYDRVASMQDAADKEQKPTILQDTIHNLVKSQRTGGLWLIDNESGLLDAYSLMYSKHHPSQGQRFIDFQRQMLHTMCLFRRTTVDRVKFLHKQRSAYKLLLNYILREEPLFTELPDVTKNTEFIKHFQQRIDEVYQWMVHCQLNASKKKSFN